MPKANKPSIDDLDPLTLPLILKHPDFVLYDLYYRFWEMLGYTPKIKTKDSEGAEHTLTYDDFIQQLESIESSPDKADYWQNSELVEWQRSEDKYTDIITDKVPAFGKAVLTATIVLPLLLLVFIREVASFFNDLAESIGQKSKVAEQERLVTELSESLGKTGCNVEPQQSSLFKDTTSMTMTTGFDHTKNKNSQESSLSLPFGDEENIPTGFNSSVKPGLKQDV